MKSTVIPMLPLVIVERDAVIWVTGEMIRCGCKSDHWVSILSIADHLPRTRNLRSVLLTPLRLVMRAFLVTVTTNTLKE